MRGFTLIEAIIYIALTSLIVGGVIAGTYPLFTNTESSVKSAHRELDAAHVYQKMSYYLNQGGTVTTPSSPGTASSLVVTVAGTAYTFAVADGAVTLREGSGAVVPLTASRLSVTSMSVVRTAGAGGAPDALSVQFVIDGVTQGPYTRYVRN